MMKVVHSWIRDLVALPDDVEAISFTLSDIGLAVESVDKVGATVAGVITARVIKTERHPDAAKVHRVFLDNGDGTEHRFQITGEDEADAPSGRITPQSPLARALMGAAPGDVVQWRKPAGSIDLEILRIDHPPDSP
jgi:hypothetical protein